MLTQSPNPFSQLGAKAINTICSISTSITSGENYNFSSEDLNKHLYGRKKVKAIDIERILRKRKLLESENPSNKRSSKYCIVFNRRTNERMLLQNLTRSPPHWFTNHSTIRDCILSIVFIYSLYLQRELRSFLYDLRSTVLKFHYKRFYYIQSCDVVYATLP